MVWDSYLPPRCSPSGDTTTRSIVVPPYFRRCWTVTLWFCKPFFVRVRQARTFTGAWRACTPPHPAPQRTPVLIGRASWTDGTSHLPTFLPAPHLSLPVTSRSCSGSFFGSFWDEGQALPFPPRHAPRTHGAPRRWHAARALRALHCKLPLPRCTTRYTLLPPHAPPLLHARYTPARHCTYSATRFGARACYPLPTTHLPHTHHYGCAGTRTRAARCLLLRATAWRVTLRVPSIAYCQACLQP